jgi:FkbH-like protein
MNHEVVPALTSMEWQRTLFATRPKRSDLLALRAAWPCRAISIAVHRNEPFEYIAAAMTPYLAFAGLSADIRLSAYDDSLASLKDMQTGDLHVVWVDFAVYSSPSDAVEWLEHGLRELRKNSSAPVLVANAHGDQDASDEINEALAGLPQLISGVQIYNRSALASSLQTRYRDQRMKRIAGSDIGDAANVLMARELGSAWLPAPFVPPIKVIALDLDGTLYSGVLGEDGPGGIELTPSHVALQRALRALQERGILLAVVSRNEAEDVAELFACRADFPLQREHFVLVRANWENKAQSLLEIANALHVGADSVLFADDNPGELVSVAQHAPAVHTLYVADPETALIALNNYPGLINWRATAEDALRTDDLRVAQERDAALARSADSRGYLESLSPHLGFRLNPADLLPRLSQLSVKTNQFNLAVRRFGEAEVALRLADPAAAVVSVALSDRLSDSGVVGAVFGRREQSVLVVEEICVSCRAMGRSLETEMLVPAVERMRTSLGADRVAFEFLQSARNRPALQWLEGLSQTAIVEDRGRIAVDWGNVLGAATQGVRTTWS